MTSHRRAILAALAAVLLVTGIVLAVAVARGGSTPEASNKDTAVSGVSIPPGSAAAEAPVQGAPIPGADGSSAAPTPDPPVSIPAFPDLPALPPMPPLPPGALALPCPPGLEQGGTCVLPFPLPPPPPSPAP